MPPLPITCETWTDSAADAVEQFGRCQPVRTVHQANQAQCARLLSLDPAAAMPITIVATPWQHHRIAVPADLAPSANPLRTLHTVFSPGDPSSGRRIDACQSWPREGPSSGHADRQWQTSETGAGHWTAQVAPRKTPEGLWPGAAMGGHGASPLSRVKGSFLRPGFGRSTIGNPYPHD